MSISFLKGLLPMTVACVIPSAVYVVTNIVGD